MIVVYVIAGWVGLDVLALGVFWLAGRDYRRKYPVRDGR